jgi:hypothetical protein
MEGALPRGEIVFPHDPNAGVLTEVRNLVVQSSIAELKARGHYERYLQFIAPVTLEDLLSRVAPGWIPVELAMEHYQACEEMNLSNEELNIMGRSVGERVQSAAFVSSAKKTRDDDFDLWQIEAQIYRVWQRLYRGGSIQVVKLGPKEKLVEQRGYPMNRYRYYRQALVTAIATAHTAVGAHITSIRIDKYDPATHAVNCRLRWA